MIAVPNLQREPQTLHTYTVNRDAPDIALVLGIVQLGSRHLSGSGLGGASWNKKRSSHKTGTFFKSKGTLRSRSRLLQEIHSAGALDFLGNLAVHPCSHASDAAGKDLT